MALTDMSRGKAGEWELNIPVDSIKKDSKEEVLTGAKLASKLKKNNNKKQLKNQDVFTFAVIPFLPPAPDFLI